jgi:hypothetical protein
MSGKGRRASWGEVNDCSVASLCSEWARRTQSKQLERAKTASESNGVMGLLSLTSGGRTIRGCRGWTQVEIHGGRWAVGQTEGNAR